jgi:hypothetical protein
MLSYSVIPHYYLIAQNRNNQLVVGITGESQQIIRSAHEIMADKKMLNGFAPAQAALIGWIAGIEKPSK